MALFQISDILWFTQVTVISDIFDRCPLGHVAVFHGDAFRGIHASPRREPSCATNSDMLSMCFDPRLFWFLQWHCCQQFVNYVSHARDAHIIWWPQTGPLGVLSKIWSTISDHHSFQVLWSWLRSGPIHRFCPIKHQSIGYTVVSIGYFQWSCLITRSSVLPGVAVATLLCLLWLSS